VRVDRLREFHKVVLLDRGSWLHVQDGMLGIEVVFDHVSLLYNRCGPRAELADGVALRRETAIPCIVELGVASPYAGRAELPSRLIA